MSCEMHCCTCGCTKSDGVVFWGQDCDNCKDLEGGSHGCYVPSIDFSRLDDNYALFANIIKPHHFLRMGALCEIIYWDGGLTGAYIRNASSKCGRIVGGDSGFWVRLKHLGNYRIKWSYHLARERNADILFEIILEDIYRFSKEKDEKNRGMQHE